MERPRRNPKRTPAAEEQTTPPKAKPAAAQAKQKAEGDDDSSELEFEDPYEDEIEQEEDEEVRKAMGNMEVDEGDEDPEDDEGDDEEPPAQVWRPGIDTLEPGQELEYDSSAYDMLHKMSLEWSCLSFDILRDQLGIQRTVFPHIAYLVAGTQAESVKNNKLYVLKVSQLCKTKHDDDEEDDASSDDDGEEDDPIMEHRWVSHPGAVNRVRSMTQKPGIVASWSEMGLVHIWNLQKHVHALDTPGTKVANVSSVMSYKHSNEGFALDWSKLTEGRLVTGDCSGQICLWMPSGPSWTVSANGFAGSGGSVEDLQWSPTEDSVFASCGVDQHIRVWDVRTQREGIAVKAHEADINVISWNAKVSYLMISGCDDGSFKIWDLRNFKPNTAAAHFRFHKGAITSVEWDPNDESQLAVSGADNQITIWDLSLERDTEVELAEKTESAVEVPPQLLFQHMGQNDMKELHWHPQIPGVVVSTAADGFDIFKPATEVGPEPQDE